MSQDTNQPKGAVTVIDTRTGQGGIPDTVTVNVYAPEEPTPAFGFAQIPASSRMDPPSDTGNLTGRDADREVDLTGEEYRRV